MKLKDEWRPFNLEWAYSWADLQARRFPDEIEVKLMERNEEGEIRIAEKHTYRIER